MPDWEIARLLPNLSLPAKDSDAWTSSAVETGRTTLSLRSPWIEIMAGDDERLKPFLNTFPTADVLLGAFSDYDATPFVPSVLAVRSDAPIRRQLDSISSFRNAAASCFVLSARAAVAAEKHDAEPSYSDLFDFHPAEIDRKGRVQIYSAALANFVGHPNSLSFGPAPALDRRLDLRFCDVTLSRLLSQAWRTAFARQRRRREILPLFRSLEIAFQAGAIPQKNIGSLYDFGLTVAHWVSALESLLWPLYGRANQQLSLTFLGQIPVHDRVLAARRFRAAHDKSLRLNALQKACTLIYRARNRFLHGDHFHKSHLVPWPNRRTRLPDLAAVVYREALRHRLEGIFEQPAPTLQNLDSETIFGWFQEAVYDDALRKAFKLKREKSL